MIEFLLFVVAFWALAYAFTIENRRRAEADDARDRYTALERQVESLRREFAVLEGRFQSGQIAAPAAVATAVPAVKPQPSRTLEAVCRACGATLAPAAEYCTRCGAGVPTPITPSQPEIKILPQPEAAQTALRPPSLVVPKTPEKPATPVSPPPQPSVPAPVKPAQAAPPPPPVRPVPTPPAPARASSIPHAAGSPPQAPAAHSQTSFSGGVAASRPTPAQPKKSSGSFEEKLGIRWFPVIGISLIVVGAGFFVGYEWKSFSHVWRAVLLYAGGLAALTGGIFLERDGRYKTLGRSLIGGGWAILALVTYAIGNVPWLQLLDSRDIDLFLLLGVIGAMVWHTLKYDSQVVTGAGFLLGFLAIGMNPSAPYNLIAGAMLITGMTVIVLRYRWWELEVFGILAAYVNHFYWLYRVYEEQGQRAVFPHHPASVALVIGYWAIFRTSYMVRKVSNRGQESVSTIAGVLNPLLFLAVMKYQGFHPEWAWKVLLVMGAVEFTLGQLPIARRRKAPFQVLSSLGAALMVAAIPFKYSGNSLDLVWLAGAEVFLLAGIFQRERLFRGFAILISFLIAGHAVLFRVAPMTERVVAGQAHRDAQLSLVLTVIAAVLYLNAHVIRRRWLDLFDKELEDWALKTLSFAASFLVVAAAYAYVPDKAVAVVLALFVAWLSATGKLFAIDEMIYQAHWVAAAAFIQVVAADRDLTPVWLGIPQRVLAFSSVAALFYLSSRFVRLSEAAGNAIFYGAYAWAATALLTLVIWFQAADWAVAVGWIGLALALSFAGQALKRTDLKWQAFALVLISFARGLVININLTATFPHFTYRLLSVSLIALGIYLLARWAPIKDLRPVYSVTGTVLLAYLGYKETEAPWTAVAWIGLALVLSLGARLWKDRALLWQTHLLAAMAVGWTLYTNFDPQYRATRLQLLTVSITAAVFYALTWITNIGEIIETERIAQAYAWAGSLLLSWLAWYQLDPINVSLAWGIFGVVLYELPDMLGTMRIDLGSARGSWHGQSYVALAGSFIHIFYANFNSRAEGGFVQVLLDRRVLTVWLLAVFYFYIYWRVHAERSGSLAASTVKARTVTP